MKGIIVKLSLALSALAFVSTAQADILLEPYLGYQTGTLKMTGSTDTKATGLVYGARAGYQSLGLMVGLDYLTGALKDDDTPSADVTPSDLGIFAGYNFPVMLRVYGVYVLKAESKSKDSSGTATLKEGKGIKLGVGFTPLPLVSINLEYFQNEYDKVDVGGTTYTNLNPKTSGYGLTVSLPLTF